MAYKPSNPAPIVPSLVETFNRLEYFGSGTDGATNLEGLVNCFLGHGGLVNPPIAASTSLLTSVKRTIYRIAAGGGGNTMGIVNGTGLLDVWRGNAPGLGGFRQRIRFGFELAANGSLHRMFAGLMSQSGTTGAQDWTTQLGIATIGFGFTQTPAPNFTGSWNLIHSTGDGVTAPTVTPLGASLPVNTTDLMQSDLFCDPNSNQILATLTNLSTGAAVATVVTTNMPAPDKFMALWAANACGPGGSSIGQFDIIQYVLQTNV